MLNDGTKTTFLHWGHLPFLPACIEGTRICLPQKEQVNRITESARFSFGVFSSIADPFLKPGWILQFCFYNFSGFSDCIVEFVWFFAAGLRHIWSSAAAAVDNGRDLLEEVGCADFAYEVVGYGSEQGRLVAFGEAENDDRGWGFLL